MTLEEKRSYIRAYCAERHCDANECVVCRIAVQDYRAGVTDAEICYATDSDELLDKRVAAIYAADKAVKDKYDHEFSTGTPDNVNHPKHYELPGGIECFDVILATQGREAAKAFCICNAIKYLFRHRNKNGVEDVKKAKWYIDKYLELNTQEDTKAEEA